MEVFAMDEWEAAAEWLRTTSGLAFERAKERAIRSLEEFLKTVRVVGICGWDFGKMRRILFVPFDTAFNRQVWLYMTEIELANAKHFAGEFDYTDEDMEKEWQLSGYERP